MTPAFKRRRKKYIDYGKGLSRLDKACGQHQHICIVMLTCKAG